VGVFIQPVNQGRIATDAKVGDWGREFFFGHGDATRNSYIIFIKYVILDKCLSEKLKKKRIITQQYFSFHLINKYNKDIDNIFIGDYKSVFMAKYDVKDIFFLDTSITLSTSFDAGELYTKAMDVSSYVDPIARGKTKGVGLAIYRVQFTWSDSSGNRPVVAAETAGFRAAVIAGYGLTQEITTDLSTSYLSSSNDLMVAGIDYISPSSLVTVTTANTTLLAPAGVGTAFCSPSTQVPYIVVRDTVGLLCLSSINTSASMVVGVRLSCAMIKLDQSTLNQLLRTQTV